MPKDWPPREDRRRRLERQVTNANRVSTYGLTDDMQKRLRDLTVEVLLQEPPHEDGEVRMRHVGAELAKQIVMAGCVKQEPWAVAIIDGVLSTELRRFASRTEREEFDQSVAPNARPAKQETLFG